MTPARQASFSHRRRTVELDMAWHLTPLAHSMQEMQHGVSEFLSLHHDQATDKTFTLDFATLMQL